MKTLNDIFAEERGAGGPVFGQHAVYGHGIIDNAVPSEQAQRRDFRGIFFRCLEMRADSLADALTRVYVERQVDQDDFEPAEFNHPWYQLIKNPSKLWSARELWQWASFNFDLAGKADFIVDKRGNMPVQLLPLFPEFGYLEPVPSAEGGIDSWKFYRSDGKIVPIRKEDAIRIHRSSPWSPYESISLIEAARFDLDTTNSMKRYRAGSVEGGGFSSPLISTDQDLSHDQHKQLSQEYKKFIGSRGHGKVGILANGAKPVQMMSARDLEYINGEQQTDKSIMIICGIPPGLFESTTTRATAEGAQVVFAQQTVSKLVTRFTEQLTHQFEIIFRADPNVLYIVAPDVVPLDKDFELRQRQLYLSTGQRTINDYLSTDGMDEDPAGNERYIPLGWSPLRSEEAIEEEPQEPERSTRKMDKRAEMWRNIDRKKRRQAELVKPALKEWFALVHREVQKKIEKEYSRSLTQDSFNTLEMEFNLMEILTPEIYRILQAGFVNGLDMAKVTGLEFTLDSPYVRSTIQTILEKQSSIPITLSEELGKTIKEGIDQKISRKEMAQNVSKFFDDYTEGKVENIANGLSTSTWEAGQDVAFNEAGVKETEWLSSRDGRVRDTHADADGQRVGINGYFNVGGAELKHPGDMNGPPEETIGCRCTRFAVIE